MENNKKFIGVFNNQNEAIRKIEELKTEGYTDSDIYAVTRDEDSVSLLRGRTDVEVDAASNNGSWMDKFMAFLSGEDEVRGGLRNMGLNDEEANRYYSDIQAGKILLYVDKDYEQFYRDRNLTADADPALGTAAFGMDREVDQVDGVRAERVDNTDLTDEEQRLQLREERLEVDKERVQTGEVQVDKDVVEEQRTVDVNVERDEVYVERRPVDEPVASFDSTPVVDEDDSIRIPITEEQVEVSKRPVVKEELIVGKRKVQDTETVHDTVKREEAHVEGVGDLEVDDERATSREFLNRRTDDELTDRYDNHDRL
ncbi:YsnF/AvaK domain-containing protein [Bacillus thermotolerans]|uniref:YsnF/AvaK domain-containing protein n=1 Tax=Bacillus thermotolerans TaxID=1221996 RepID=UPI00058278A3|nr:YsnF/AvaK domain-containing protein [Bacillus thermotolerans]KKB37136.1 hypothetical protein QY97_00510 [Bacillus thermotolerans]